jgi:Arc/MetJ family transcription regulator
MSGGLGSGGPETFLGGRGEELRVDRRARRAYHIGGDEQMVATTTATTITTENLIAEAKRCTGLRTKKQVVDFALSELIRRQRLEELRGMLGKTNLVITQEDLERWRAEDLEE